MEQSVNSVFEAPEKGFLDCIEAYGDKGYFIRSKGERNFLRNFFLICEFISPTYTFDFRTQFANTLFVETEN